LLLLETGKKTLRLGALPTTNLPVKSVVTSEPAKRKELLKRVMPVETKQKHSYKDFEDYSRKVKKLKLGNWKSASTVSYSILTLDDEKYQVPKFEVYVDISLEFTVRSYGWRLPDNHQIYKENRRSLRFSTVSSLLSSFNQYQICSGIDNAMNLPQSKLSIHSIPLRFTVDPDSEHPNQSDQSHRSSLCSLLLLGDSDSQCLACISLQKTLRTEKKNLSKKIEQPASKFAPLSVTHPERIKKALIKEREMCKKLTFDVERLKKEVNKKGIKLDSDLADDFETILTANTDQITPFMKLFWDEQKKLAQQNQFQYHPMLIRFCLSLASKSAKAYDELRDSKVLVLPSRRTLRDYKNAIRPSTGFNPAVIEELVQTTKSLKGNQRNIVMSLDEVKIQEDLVFDKHSGELIGFVDLGDPELNYSSFKDIDALASHCMVFYIRGLSSDLKFSLAYFATKTVTAPQIFTLFWKAVSILELTCNLHVIALVSDGASSNRNFYRMHKDISDCIDSPVVYRTINLFGRDRFVYFFADAPHLMKTLRNAVYHSREHGKGTRELWNGNQILWRHISQVVQDDLNRGLKLLPKLSQNHIYLTSYSSMTVSYATQILSSSMANVMNHYYPEFKDTATYCQLTDGFFDCCNVRNQLEGKKKRKTFLEPYRDVNDSRFVWLKNVFLEYFTTWKELISNRADLTPKEKEKMFIPMQTFEGLQMTVYSLVEATQYLLQNGVDFVLTERFNQDVLEEYFGRQRSLGRFNDAPNLFQFGYNSNTLRMQRSVVPVKGNTRGAHSQKRKPSWTVVDDQPLKKRSSGKVSKK